MNGARRAETGPPAPDDEPGGPTGPSARSRLSPLKRVLLATAGGFLLVIGAALLILPGPGLLLVLAGLILLSRAVPAVARFVEPVRGRAMVAVEGSVASVWRIAGSVLAGLALIVAGVIVGLRLLSWLPFDGWSTGASLILSGFILFGLLGWSYRRVHGSPSGR
ncbi:PGPGW domain-containing protein [Streptomyces sp. NBC_01190]|uniref:PGPGW domain-containing protein n=1 Tax=Streptomyces sp. NBC_01190 TaxID=2903767 RepID=UPI0038646DD4|nr:hypothetical protein OG519_32205 [Streptomyces sp. NBC_01190]